MEDLPVGRPLLVVHHRTSGMQSVSRLCAPPYIIPPFIAPGVRLLVYSLPIVYLDASNARGHLASAAVRVLSELDVPATTQK